MYCGIYKITNKINGKVYIGQSVDIHRRWRAEKNNAFNPQSCEYDCSRSKAFRKYGLDNFEFEVVEECLAQDLNNREVYWANYYNSYVPRGYNEALCGAHCAHKNKLKDLEQVNQIINDLKFTNMSGIEIGKKYQVSDQTISDINRGTSWYQDDIMYPIRSRTRKQHYCIICGIPITDQATYCIDCGHKSQRQVERPSKEQLLEEIATSSFIAVGKKYGVSDKAISKWCKNYGLPIHKKDLVNLYKSLKK